MELERYAIRRWFESAKQKVKAEEKKFRALAASGQSDLMPEIQRFLVEYKFELRPLQEHLNQLARDRDRARAEGESTQALAIQRALAARDELIREFREKVVRLHSDVAAVIQQWCESLQRAQERVRCEARPLGVELPS